jgi:hypothetical protein
MPPDFLEALEARLAAKTFFDTLDSAVVRSTSS